MALSSRGKLLVVLAAPVLAFGGLELGLRLFGFEHQLEAIPVLVWNRKQDETMRSTEALHQTDFNSLWAPRPGAAVPDQDETINAAGYRGPQLDVEKPDGVLRVALIGESATFGMGLPWEGTAAAQLVELAAERGQRLEVLNAGVIGYTAWQGVERYKTLVREHDVDVVFASFGTVNEHYPCKGLPDERKLEQLHNTTRYAGRLAMWMRVNLRIAHLLSWAGMRSEGTTVEDEKQRFREEALKNVRSNDYGQLDWDGVRRVSLESFGRSMWALRDEVHADDARFVMVAMPRGPGMVKERPMVEHYTLALRELQTTLDVALLDLHADYHADVEAGGDLRAWFVPGDELHLSEVGNRRLAERMLGYVDG
jgi:lysophospholipase L1-like esterase